MIYCATPNTVAVRQAVADGLLGALLRDLLHESSGRLYVFAAIAAGAAFSFAFAPGLAVASAVAFGISELADFAVYAPMRRRHWGRAVAASAIVGAVVDSLIFLRLAGFPAGPANVAALVVGKVAVTAAFLAIWARFAALRPVPAV